MSGGSNYQSSSLFGWIVNEAEEIAIATILGIMTILTFVNVVLRYVFNSSIIWGLELVLMLFAWMVLLGISYGIKVTSHLGVDAVTNLLPARGQRIAALLAAFFCVLYATLLMKGAWDYWAPFAALQPTSGRWLPTGFESGVRDRAFMITDQIPMPGFLRFLEDMINFGDTYDKLPRVVAYVILPFGCGLILLRSVQAAIGVINGSRTSLIVSHEAEEALAEVSKNTKGSN